MEVPHQAQVEQLHLSGGGQHQVGGLDVAVNQAVLVQVLQTQGRPPDHLTGFRQRQRTPLLNDPGQVVALDKLQDEVRNALNLPGVMSRDQIGVAQAGAPYGQELLLTEPRDDFAVPCQAGVAHLDGHEAPAAEVARLVDAGHAAAAEFRQDLVTGQCRAGLHHRPPRPLVGRRRFRVTGVRG